MTADTTLAPCPWCGGTPRLETRDVEPQGDPWYGKRIETFVLCDCGACLFDGSFHEGFYEPEKNAVAAWNRRAQAPAPQGPALVPLTDEQAVELYSGWDYGLMDDEAYAVIRHVEAAHGITGAPNGKPT